MSKETFKSYIESLIKVELINRGCYNESVIPAIVAMACVEGNYGESILAKNYHNHFGMKCGSYWQGTSVNMQTHEEYNGNNVVISDNFRTYASDEDGVSGFFDFISTNRYANLMKATTPLQFLENIKADGYATSSTYVSTCMNVVNNLYGETVNTTRLKVDLKTGKDYTLLDNMAVRHAPSLNSPLVGYKGLTADGKKHDTNRNGYLEKGTVVTCKDYQVYSDNAWIKIPSGWLCAYDATSVYVK